MTTRISERVDRPQDEFDVLLPPLPANGRVRMAEPSVHYAPSRLGPVCALSALGLLIVSISFAGSRAGDDWAAPAFWIGMVAIIVPIAFRLLGKSAATSERMWLVLVLALLLYVVKVLHSPDGFSFHDEFGQYRATEDILITGHLFNDNPVVRVYADYPGMQSVAAAIASISGLSIFVSGLITIGVARAVLALALFAFLTKVTRSARVAGIAVAIYACNPNFIYFDGQFGYESLAIPLAIATLWATARADDTRTGQWSVAGFAIALAAATVITHHLTSYALVLALVVWSLIKLSRRPSSRPGEQTNVVYVVAAASAAFVGAWWIVAGVLTGAQLSAAFGAAFGSVWDIVTGAGSARAPFSGNPGYSDALLERIVGLTSVGILLATLPAGLWAIWKARHRHATVLLLGLVALAYPATLVIRLGANGAETSNRTSEFVFIGLGVGLGLAIVGWVQARLSDRAPTGTIRALLASGIGLLFVGGLLVGWPSQARMPGPYQPGGGSRSIDYEGEQAAEWARSWLPDMSTIIGDTANATMMAAYGHQNPQNGQVDGTPIGTIYFSPSLRARDIEIIRTDKIAYVVVDSRMSDALPRSGRYFEEAAEPRRYSRPPSLPALTKFDRDPRIDRIYSSGNLTIYETSRLLDNTTEGTG